MAAPISFAAMAERKTEDQPLKVVQLDAHVVLKIVKHCKEGFPHAGHWAAPWPGRWPDAGSHRLLPFPVRYFWSTFTPRVQILCIEAALSWVCCLLTATTWVLSALADAHKHCHLM